MKKTTCPWLAIICQGDASSSGAESGTDSGNNGGSDNYGSESYP